MVTVYASNPNPPAGGADLSGPDCVGKNDVKVYQVSAANKAGATNYAWWVNGSSQNVTAGGASATVNFGPYFTGGQVCVGVNYSGAPYYKQLCKSVGVCGTTSASMNLPNGAEQLSALVYPTASSNSFTISADRNILRIEVLDLSGRRQQLIGRQLQGQHFVFGDLLAVGTYYIRILYEDKSMKVLNVMKTK